MNDQIRTAILISGSGSNMEALIKAAKEPDYPAKIVVVISNRSNAGGLEKAKRLGIKTSVIDHKAFTSREDFERALDKELQTHKTELICNAGFMRLLTPWFVRRWTGRQINIHPSLLPKFKGLHTHKRALEAGETEHGCTVHHVNEAMDEGEIIAQARVPVHSTDTEEILAMRVLAEEHRLYPLVLRDVANSL